MFFTGYNLPLVHCLPIKVLLVEPFVEYKVFYTGYNLPLGNCLPNSGGREFNFNPQALAHIKNV